MKERTLYMLLAVGALGALAYWIYNDKARNVAPAAAPAAEPAAPVFVIQQPMERCHVHTHTDTPPTTTT